MKRVMVTGFGGQVGAAVVERLIETHDITAYDRAALDLTDPARIAAAIAKVKPEVIVNAGAYTAVDRAEGDAQVAHVVNGIAPGLIGQAAKRVGALVIHFSTDYVFDGTKPAPYVETDPTNPLGAYGASKLEGEKALAASGASHVILRTSWVYGPHGRNFLLTMLNLAKTKDEVHVVDDQHGAPTSSLQLARATQAILGRDPTTLRSTGGVYHCTAAGEVTWCGFARAIFERQALFSPGFQGPRVEPITTAEYPTYAKRPANSRLSNAKLQRVFGLKLETWEDALDEVLGEMTSA